MAEHGDLTQQPHRHVVRTRKAADQTGQMSFVWEMPRPKAPTNYEQRMMILLGVKSPEELERVLSEPPDEKVLETMGPPDDLYAEDWKQDRADEAEIDQDEMETGKKNGKEAIFFTKDAGTLVLWVEIPPPPELQVMRHFSRLVILPGPGDLDVYNVDWSAFVRRGHRGEVLIYEEV